MVVQVWTEGRKRISLCAFRNGRFCFLTETDSEKGHEQEEAEK